MKIFQNFLKKYSIKAVFELVFGLTYLRSNDITSPQWKLRRGMFLPATFVRNHNLFSTLVEWFESI